MSLRRQGAIINFRVHPKVKAAWDELDQKTKSFLVRKFQMEVLGLSDVEVPEDVKAYVRIEYDEKSLNMLKEVLTYLDEEAKKREEKLKDELLKKEEEIVRLKAWIKDAKGFFKNFLNTYNTALCEYGGLASLKSAAKSLLERSP